MQRFAERSAFRFPYFEVGTGSLLGRENDFVRVFRSRFVFGVEVAVVGFVRAVGRIGGTGRTLRMVVYMAVAGSLAGGCRPVFVFRGRAACTPLHDGERQGCRYQ